MRSSKTKIPEITAVVKERIYSTLAEDVPVARIWSSVKSEIASGVTVPPHRFSKREKITNLLVLIYTGKEDIPFVEIGNILKALENAAVEDFDKMELLYVPVLKTPKGFLRMLVQM